LIGVDLQREDLCMFLRHLRDYHLTTLSLNQLHLVDEDAALISVAIQECSITTINLSDNEIRKKGLDRLADALEQSAVTYFNVKGNQFRDIHRLVEVLPRTMIRYLDVSQNGLGDSNIMGLAEVLPRTRLVTLRLRYVGMTNEGLASICHVLPQTSITELVVSGVAIRPVLVTALFAHSLESLDLSQTNLGPDHLPMLIQGVHSCPTLKRLHIHQNPGLTDERLRAFMFGIRMCMLENVQVDTQNAETRVYVERIVERMKSETVKKLILLVASATRVRYHGHVKWKMDIVRLIADRLG
jgi:hypothetical protein